MRYLLLLLTIITVCLGSRAERRDSINVWGKVIDLFTGEEIEKGSLTIYDEQDSIVVIDTIHPSKDAYWGTWKYKEQSGYKLKLPKGGQYRVRFDVEGYSSEPQDLHIPDKQYHKYTREWMQNFKLKKLPKEYTIDGVTVRATRIKMVVKGDTVEYNADAFNLAEGSMLDKLIEAMPGMELGDDGVITHNGKKVESLLVNGKDFFDGDPKLALENLPAYTVKKVQVYRRDDEAGYLIKDSVKRDEMKKLVVDVKLKKEYNKGWMVNADLAGGTKGRYTTKLVGMYFTDAFKFIAAGGLNNLNDRGLTNDRGEMNSQVSPMGLHNIKKVQSGFTYEHEDKLRLAAGFDFTHADDDNETMNSSTTYLTGGDTYNRSRWHGLTKSTQLNFYSRLRNRARSSFLWSRPLNISYSRNRGNHTSSSATFNDDPMDSYRGAALDSVFMPVGSTRLEQILTNTVLDQTMTETHNTSVSSNASFRFHDPLFGNDMHFDYGFNAGRFGNDSYQHYLLDNRAADNKDYRNIATFAPAHRYDYNFNISYDIELMKNWSLNINYGYNQSYDKSKSSRYRLDSLSGWGEGTTHGLGMTPSSRDSMLMAMDVRNSYHTSKRFRQNEVRIGSWFSIAEKLSGWIALPLRMRNSKAWDNRNNISQRKTANLTSLDPTLHLWYNKQGENGKVSWMNFNYNFNHNMRDASQLLDIYDDTNPLFIREPNTNLRNPRNHHIEFGWGYGNMVHTQNYGFGGSWDVNSNSVATATLYDRNTGITTYRPLNISGNWSANLNGRFSRNIDKNDHWELATRLSLGYNHSADYISDTQSDIAQIQRSVVHNYNTSTYAHLKYMFKKTNVMAEGSANWRVQNSKRENFNRVSAVDFNYGIKANGPIVWGLEYDTEIKMYSRRGYNDASMNDDYLIWNASISKSLLKGKPLTLRLEVVDLLGQRSNVQNNINSQGRTETWHNSVPRYALLHVVYKFNSMAKKKGAKPTEE